MQTQCFLTPSSQVDIFTDNYVRNELTAAERKYFVSEKISHNNPFNALNFPHISYIDSALVNTLSGSTYKKVVAKINFWSLSVPFEHGFFLG